MTLACISRECQDPCLYQKCGINAVCDARNHRAYCSCIENHKGDPYTLCKRYECLRDEDCPTTLACRNEKCVDPCACALNAECDARNHRGYCTCLPRHTGDPYGIECVPSKHYYQSIFLNEELEICLNKTISVKEPVIVDPGCQEDADCPSRHACFSGDCKDPCRELRPCAAHAICTVYDDLPRRTMTCVCEPGFTGKGDVRCDPIGNFDIIDMF